MKIRSVDIYHYIVKQIIIIYHSLKQFSEFMMLQKLSKIEENEKFYTNFKKCTLIAENKVLYGPNLENRGPSGPPLNIEDTNTNTNYKI